MSVQQTTPTKPRSKPDVKVRSAKRHLCQILNVFITGPSSLPQTRLPSHACWLRLTMFSLPAVRCWYHNDTYAWCPPCRDSSTKSKSFLYCAWTVTFGLAFDELLKAIAVSEKSILYFRFSAHAQVSFPEWLFTAIYMKILKISGEKNFYDEISKTGNFR